MANYGYPGSSDSHTKPFMRLEYFQDRQLPAQDRREGVRRVVRCGFAPVQRRAALLWRHCESRTTELVRSMAFPCPVEGEVAQRPLPYTTIHADKLASVSYP